MRFDLPDRARSRARETLVANRAARPPAPRRARATPSGPTGVDRGDAAGVADLDLGSDLVESRGAPATRAQLARVHDAAYLDELGVFCYEGGGDLDQDTYATYDSCALAAAQPPAPGWPSSTSWRAAATASASSRAPAGAPRDCATGRWASACSTTSPSPPPRSSRAASASLIVDWDVHHGNGTQAIFWDEHRRPLRVDRTSGRSTPAAARPREVGGPGAPGLHGQRAAAGRGDRRRAARGRSTRWSRRWWRASPRTWVLVSAGFDAHRADPLADLALSAGDFADLATGRGGASRPRRARLALFLEGGYDLDAAARLVAAALGALLGAGEPHRGARRPAGPGAHVAHALADAAQRPSAAQRGGALSVASSPWATTARPTRAGRGALRPRPGRPPPARASSFVHAVGAASSATSAPSDEARPARGAGRAGRRVRPSTAVRVGWPTEDGDACTVLQRARPPGAPTSSWWDRAVRASRPGCCSARPAWSWPSARRSR